MKYIKKSEIISGPEAGDYVIIDAITCGFSEDKIQYLQNTIGKIEKIADSEPKYLVHFDNLPNCFYGPVTDRENLISFYTKELYDWSKNKEELETILNAKKYNL